VRALLRKADLRVEDDPASELERRRRTGDRFVLLAGLDSERAVYVTSGRDGAYEPFVAAGAHLPDAATLFPSAASYQAEAHELWGTRFEGIEFDPGVRGTFRHRPVPSAGAALEADEPLPLPAPRLAGEPVVRIPFGPVRDGTVESLLHRFHYLGEHIVELEQQLGYKHRAAEGRLPRASVEQLPVFAERVSGPNGVAFALAMCQAVETASGITVPPRADALRAIVAELERVYNHFRDIGRLVASTTLRVGAAQAHALQEWTQRLGAGLTGHRFLRGVVAVGGVRRDLDVSGLAREASRLEVDARAYFEALEATELFVDRLETTGMLAPERARAWGAVGPVGRASGVATDARRDAPYGAYRDQAFRVPVFDAGDALARFRVRCEEVLVSLYLIREIAETLPEGSLRVSAPSSLPEDALALGWSEGVRGEVVAVLVTDGRGDLSRVVLRGGSRHNWPLFPDTVHDSFLMDYAINEASWGLSVASHDR
jgi:Ni,Fe-hydrogenase III large subunit